MTWTMLKNACSGHKSPTGATISAHLRPIPLRAKRAKVKGAAAGPACLGPPRRDRLVSMWAFGYPERQITAARTSLWGPCGGGRSVQRACLWVGSCHRRQAHAEKRAPGMGADETNVGNGGPPKKRHIVSYHDQGNHP